MIFAWAGLVVAVVAVLRALPPSAMISTVVWPEDAPLSLHDNRARDPHLRHLARILAGDSTAEAQHTVTDLVDGVLNTSAITLFDDPTAARERLGPQVAGFISQPPPKDHDQFLRRLGDVLDRIERL